MAYLYLKESDLRRYCEAVFRAYGFSEAEAAGISDVILTADLYGIESHGVQRLHRYADALDDGFADPKATIETVFETPSSAVLDADRTMGQVAARYAMELAIRKAKETGFGAVTVRRSNHFGIAGYWSSMAAAEDLLGISMTSTEAIAIPTNGKKAILGTSPIAVCMPADPVPFWFDAATTVVTRGKLEVYQKLGKPLPEGWAADADGKSCRDAGTVIRNICNKAGGGIFPLGGESELTGSHKGYGLGVLVELLTSVFSGGTLSPHVVRSGNADTNFTVMALDYGMFGDKARIREQMSQMLRELRESPLADGCERIYTHGEKELESRERLLATGIPVQERTLAELKLIAERLSIDPSAYLPV